MKSGSGYCWEEKRECVKWVDRYFKDCLCSYRDSLSFGCGVVSLVAWAVAEIPQIITNFQTKSSHGVSLLFLLTWVLGDIFNLLGCLLEPATLPTQLYTALLYTASTIVLVLQTLYYDHIYDSRKCRHNRLHQQDNEETKSLNEKPSGESGIPIPSAPVTASPRRDFYFMSARSLAGSTTPPCRSYLKTGPRSGPSSLGNYYHSSSDDDQDSTRPIPIPIPGSLPKTSARQIPRPVSRGAMLVASASLPVQGNALSQALLGYSGRRMVNEGGVEGNALGQWLGWLMAAIYMGGRIPQIVLNIKRGSVEGLNPLMFIFALIANAAYVGSILVRSTEWGKIKANLPWLLDAAVCVVLDLFIIMQYVYYKYMRKNTREEDEDDYYGKAGKLVVS